jgi:hypothetical protein
MSTCHRGWGVQGGARPASYLWMGRGPYRDLEAIRAWQRDQPQLKSKTDMTHWHAMTLLSEMPQDADFVPAQVGPSPGL